MFFKVTKALEMCNGRGLNEKNGDEVIEIG